jgi:hypothetical protein
MTLAIAFALVLGKPQHRKRFATSIRVGPYNRNWADHHCLQLVTKCLLRRKYYSLGSRADWLVHSCTKVLNTLLFLLVKWAYRFEMFHESKVKSNWCKIAHYSDVTILLIDRLLDTLCTIKQNIWRCLNDLKNFKKKCFKQKFNLHFSIR